MAGSKILIVDDDHGFITPLKRALRTEHHQIHIATNKAQAQDVMLQERPDMVVLGTMMPRGDAFAFHEWLKAMPQFNDIPIIVVDAPPEKQFIKGWSRHEGLRLQSDDYFTRPIDTVSIAARIEKLLDKTVSRIRVLVADDHAVVRDGICAVIDLQRDMQVVGEATDGREAVYKTLELMPDVVLMDIVMPEINGLDATKEICQQWDQAKVLILSQYDDQETIHGSTLSGALGFIPKRSASSELIEGIRSVSQGRRLKQPVAS